MLLRSSALQSQTARLTSNVFRILSPLRNSSPFCASQGLFSTIKRTASAATSTRWKTRQSQDHFAREAKVQGLKSRAAFKLLQLNEKYKLFRKGDTVVDLGYAPGSWSQVAVNRTAPRGRVIGVDILPAQPPRGASSIQGNFLSPEIQAEVRAYVQDSTKGRPVERSIFRTADETNEPDDTETPEALAVADSSYIDMQHKATEGPEEDVQDSETRTTLIGTEHMSRTKRDAARGWVVDVVLSDMSEPWEQTSGYGKRSISDPYFRLMNTSGMPFRDHAGSMDLCNAALSFCYDTLRTGGHFVCKYYQGEHDKALEKSLKRLFEKVHRDKPSASRSESREGYFVALRRKEVPSKEDVFAES